MNSYKPRVSYNWPNEMALARMRFVKNAYGKFWVEFQSSMKDQSVRKACPTVVPLYELLQEADLLIYHGAMQEKLKVYHAEHLRYVTEADLLGIGMSKPEMRRFFKTYQKHYPGSYIGKLRQKLLSKTAGHSCSAIDDRSITGSSGSLCTARSGQHIIPSESISLCQQLGCGEFASVWQGVWSSSDRNIDKVQVAVKKILPEKMHTNPLDFLQEVAIMHRVDHANIVRFYGVVLNPKSLMLVTELAPLRSLAECLRQPNFRETFSVMRLCDFAEQICAGMAHLEDSRLIHRDLAARNILVFSLTLVKVADFGLSRALGAGEEYYHSNISANLKLPIAWCAPECITYLKFTSASDVWSFGVTLWEMFTYGFQPWAGLTGQQILDCINVPRCRRLDMPDLCPTDYYNLMLQCWEQEPGNRPKFSTLLSLLPEVRPEQVRAIRNCNDRQSDHLQYNADAVITVLNKRPREYPDGYYWKGALNTGRAGLFLPETTISLLNCECPGLIGEAMTSAPVGNSADQRQHHQFGLNLRWPAGVNKVFGSTRILRHHKDSGKPAKVLISAPQNDFRHTGHVGSDGTYFGDVAFLQASSAKEGVPKQVVTPFSSDTEEMRCRREMANGGKERLRSECSETALLLNYEMPGACKSQADDSRSPDNSGSLLDEMFEALHQANLGFLDDEMGGGGVTSKDCFSDTVGSGSSETQCLIDKTTEKEHPMDLEQQGNVKPLSHRDSKMLDELTTLAVELADRAMREQNEQLRSIVNGGGTTTTAASSKGFHSPITAKKLSDSIRRLTRDRNDADSAERPSFCSRLPPEGEVKLSAESEKAYRSMVEEGLACVRAADGGEPQRSANGDDDKSVVKEQADNEKADVLRPPRDDGSAVLRMLRSSTRVAPNAFVAAGSHRKGAEGRFPPPLPPRSREVRRHSLELEGNGLQQLTAKVPPPVPPKSSNCKDQVEVLRSQLENCRASDQTPNGMMTQSAIVSGTIGEGEALPFTMESVDKYELLDFVLSPLTVERARAAD